MQPTAQAVGRESRKLPSPSGAKERPRHFIKGLLHDVIVKRFFPVDLAGDFVLMSNYTGKEVVE
jgi:hypothetical protein